MPHRTRYIEIERERERAREEDYSREKKHYSNVACFKN
jgi:hypothetical protein